MAKRKASRERPVSADDDHCVIHSKEAKPGNFIRFSDIRQPEVRFQSLLDIRDRRLSQEAGSPHRLEHICQQIPAEFSELKANYGYHRSCYQFFTMNLNRLKTVQTDDEIELRRSRRSATTDNILFEPNCIFCKSFGLKKVFVKGAWTTEGLSVFSHGGGAEVQRLAEQRQDEELLTRIRGVNLFSAEARYHIHCRKKYVDSTSWQSSNPIAVEKARNLMETHDACFAKICELIDQKIISGQEVMKMTDLRNMYVAELSKTQFPNPDYRASKVKDKLKKHEKYSEKLCFVALDRSGGQFQSELVFSRDLDLGTAVKRGYFLSCTEKVSDVAQLLRNIIHDAFGKCDDLPWPPTASYLQSVENPVPEDLQSFLRLLISGNESIPQSDKTERLVSSIGQDLCRAATTGRWKMPKHILVCMTLRHLFRSAQLSTLMNKLGHSESYSYSLELETALANAVQEASTVLTPQIVRNPAGPALFHSDFDNFDQFINDLSGSGSVHTAHGIMLQNVMPDQQMSEVEVSSVPKTGIRSLQRVQEDSLPPCYLNQRNSPELSIKRLEHPEGEEAMSKSQMTNITWCVLRLFGLDVTAGQQTVPGWGGFISEIGQKPANLTTIDYYPVINHPITENSTVQECLRMSKEASDEVGQKYTITTFDLGVCMKAYPIMWKNPDTYKDHIVMIGSFHLVCAYLKMVGKKMEASGFSEILLESGLMSSGSLSGVLKGTNYSRAMYCHKAMAEGFERLLLRRYQRQKGTDGTVPQFSILAREKLEKLLSQRNRENFEKVTGDPEIQAFTSEYLGFRTEVSNGSLGKTAQFWISYLNHIWLVMSLLNSVKTNDFFLYGACLTKMANLFFSYDGQNYARYLTFFSVFLTNIEESHPGATPLLMLGAIGVARSHVPGNLCPVDKTIEETFMRHAKSKSGAGGSGVGVSGLLNNYEAYKRWALTAHERSRYLDVMLQTVDMAGEDSTADRHRDTRPSQIRNSETATEKVIDAVESFLNPFEMDEDELHCIVSGAPVPPSLCDDIMEAEKLGEDAKMDFINERLKQNTDFFSPIRKQRLKTFANMSKTAAVKTTNNKTLQYKQQGNVAFQLLVRSQTQPEKLDLRALLCYPLMPVPSSLGTPDGYLLKTNKAKGFEYLTKETTDADQPPDEMTLNVEDGNAVFYYMKDVPRTFKQISETIFDISTSNKTNVVFSTDMYKEKSVKSLERSIRGCGEKFIVQGENTRRPVKWKEFLSNDQNKLQLIHLIHRVWSSPSFASKIGQKEVILICEGKAYLLTSKDGQTVMTEMPDLTSDQEETDTRVVLYCYFAKSQGYSFVRVRSPDTDIFFILLYYAVNLDLTILFDTGTGNKRRLIDVSKLAKELTPDYCNALLGLHAFSRCDTTSAFKGIGKVKPIRILQKKPKYREALKALGEAWTVSEDLLLSLENFTCEIYKPTKVTNIKHVDELRYEMLTSKCGGPTQAMDPKKNIDLSTLPPPRVCLSEHIRRVNYQVGIWKRAHIPSPDIPDPTAGHGWTTDGESLQPKWYEGDALPSQLADVLEKLQSEEDESDENDSDLGSDEEDYQDSSSDSD